MTDYEVVSLSDQFGNRSYTVWRLSEPRMPENDRWQLQRRAHRLVGVYRSHAKAREAAARDAARLAK